MPSFGAPVSYGGDIVAGGLQKHLPATTRRQTRLIRNRLELMDPGL